MISTSLVSYHTVEGVARINLCNSVSASEPDVFVNLSAFGNPHVEVSSPNDIAVVGDVLYVTDFTGVCFCMS